ncbi:MAG: hypothetical protein ACJAWS_001403 [Oleiphilaceae bacterium]
MNECEFFVVFNYTQQKHMKVCSKNIIIETKMSLIKKSSCEWQESFKEIQCYQNNEVKLVIQRLLNDNYFLSIIGQFFLAFNEPLKDKLNTLAKIEKIGDLQDWVEKTIFPIIEKRYEKFSVSGLSDLDSSQAYIFISNHRDIVMDPLLLNKALRAHSFSTANCAIGDNLLQHPSACDLALLNRCFKIFRSIKSPRAILKAMKIQSSYIQFLRFNKKENIWIAQKEGRAKDNIDKTNPALIKMLGLAKPKHELTHNYLSELNIVPVSFSYEWDPCDIDKSVELAAQYENANYAKDKLDDFNAAKKGLEGNKGNIHIHFGKSITSQASQSLDHKLVAEMIDQSILQNYQLFPVNYAAYKKLNRELPANCPFSKQEINSASKILDDRLENTNEDITKRVLQAYAQIITKSP